MLAPRKLQLAAMKIEPSPAHLALYSYIFELKVPHKVIKFKLPTSLRSC
jgi:hypothetical protein